MNWPKSGVCRSVTILEDLRACDVYIVTVPTPIDRAKRPDLGALQGRQPDRRPGSERG